MQPSRPEERSRSKPQKTTTNFSRAHVAALLGLHCSLYHLKFHQRFNKPEGRFFVRDFFLSSSDSYPLASFAQVYHREGQVLVNGQTVHVRTRTNLAKCAF